MCGAEQPGGIAPIVAKARPSTRPPPPRPGAAGKLLQIAGGVALMAFLGLLAWKLFPRFAPPPKPVHDTSTPLPPPPIALPSARIDPQIGAADLGAVDPSTVLARAQTHARKWDRDALLVSLDAAPVAAGKVDAEHGGRVVVMFARSSGSLLPGARVSAERFMVTIDASGPRTQEAKDLSPARSVAEPNCPLDQAWRTMVASGVPSSARVAMHYSMSDKHDRAVWQTTVEGDPKLTRTLDGLTCNVIAGH
jgi:hypothetical protein